ncbi:MAG: polysaccharide biosynthesis tyrosine autokinase, partial [Pseudomonadota bacterium]
MTSETPIPGPSGSDRRELWQPDPSVPDIYREYPAPPSSPVIDVSSLRGLLHRQFLPMVIAVIVAVIVGAIVTVLQTPRYTASATARIEPNGSQVISTLGLASGISASQYDEYIRTVGEVVKSRSMADTVATELNLGSRAGFLGSDIDEQRPANSSDEEWAAAKNSMAARQVMQGLNVQLPRGNTILTLRYSSSDPAFAAEIANAYVSALAESDTKDDIAQNEYLKEFLSGQIAETRSQLREAEVAANNYARNAALVASGSANADGGSVATVTGTNLASINSTFGQARADRIRKEQRWRTVENMSAELLPEVQQNGTAQSLVAERIKLENQLVVLRERYDEQFPEVVDANRRLQQIDRQISEIGESIKSTIRNEYIVARNQEQALQSELQSVTSSALDEQDRQVELGALSRETEALSAKLNALLNAYNVTSASTNVDRGTITVLDTAVVPGAPSSPNILQNMLLALFAGFGLAGVVAFVREFMDDRIRSLEAVEERIGIPLIGHTPLIEESGLNDDSQNQFGELVEAYASIKTTIEYSIPYDKNVIQVTSSKAGEGKSTTALILAELFARLGRRTLLVDADIRRPSIGALIEETTGEAGFAEVLLGHAKIEDAITKGAPDNLDVLAIGRMPTNPVELLSSPQFDEFIKRESANYSMVIIDSPPVVGLADAPLISR